MKSIGEQLAEQARLRPGTPALVDERAGRVLTFAELEAEVARASAWWRGRGLRHGQAVLVFVPMSAELYVSLLALFRIGAVALFLDPSAGREHLERCCARWRPDALLAIPKAHLLRLRSRALRAIPLKVTTGGWIPGAVRLLSGRAGATAAGDEVRPGDPALVTFTSGSTGVPKGAVRTHGFLLAQHEALAPSIELEPGDVDLATLPVFTLANLAAGATTVLPDADLRRPGAVDAGRLWEQIGRAGVNRITASPAFFERLIAEGRRRKQSLPGLRKLHTGGAPVFPRLLDALRELAPNAKVVAVYGSTEAEPIAHVETGGIGPEDFLAMRAGRGLLAGEPVPGLRLRVIRDAWGKPLGEPDAAGWENMSLPPGQTGEIVVAGDHVLKGYLGGVGDEETKFRVAGETWHRTGDAGSLDERGRLWLAGRCAARIDDGRGSLYPFGVECVAMTFPQVRRAACVGAEGRRLLAVEAGGDAALAAELSAATAWAHVDAVLFLDAMPVDGRHNAKIDYPALRRRLQRRS